jgi:hypothetical protein
MAEVLGLFGASAEDERVAPFQPNNAPTRAGVFGEQGVDLVLAQCRAPRALAGEDPGSPRRSEGQEPRMDQMVINYHLCCPKRITPS